VSDINDTAKLYQLFGGQASDYQELRRELQAQTAKQRWPLLAWLDLSALHVSEPPKVQLGETPSAAANQRVQRPMTPATAAGKPFVAPVASPAPMPAQTAAATPQHTSAIGISPMGAALQAKAKTLAGAIDFKRMFSGQTAQPVASVAPAPAPVPVPVPASASMPVPANLPMAAPVASPLSSASASAATPAPAVVVIPAAAPAKPQAFAAFQAPQTDPTQDVAPFLKNLLKQEDPAMAAAAAAMSGFSGMAGTPQQAAPVEAAAPSPVLRDIFARIAQPAQSQPAPAPQGMPGNIWANLSSKL